MKKMGIKILRRAKPLRAVLNPKKNDNMGKNIVVSVTTIKGVSFGLRSTRAERGANNISTKADQFGAPKKWAKISRFLKIN